MKNVSELIYLIHFPAEASGEAVNVQRKVLQSDGGVLLKECWIMSEDHGSIFNLLIQHTFIFDAYSVSGRTTANFSSETMEARRQ